MYHNKRITAVFTSFVLIAFCHFLRLQHQHCLKFTRSISRAIQKEQDGPILPARATNQNQRLQTAHGHCQRYNNLGWRLCAHVTKNRLIREIPRYYDSIQLSKNDATSVQRNPIHFLFRLFVTFLMDNLLKISSTVWRYWVILI